MKKIVTWFCLISVLVSVAGCMTGGREITERDKEMLRINPNMPFPK